MCLFAPPLWDHPLSDMVPQRKCAAKYEHIHLKRAIPNFILFAFDDRDYKQLLCVEKRCQQQEDTFFTCFLYMLAISLSNRKMRISDMRCQ